MKKFKYCVGGICIRSSPEKQQKTLNKMGKNGFELVSVSKTEGPNAYFMFYFKKELEEVHSEVLVKQEQMKKLTLN